MFLTVCRRRERWAARAPGRRRETSETLMADTAKRQHQRDHPRQAAEISEREGPVRPGASTREPTPGRERLARVCTYGDDPFSEAFPTRDPRLAHPVAVDCHPPPPALGFRIGRPAPPVGLYRAGSDQFLYWSAAEALGRAINFWAPLLPEVTRWTIAGTSELPVELGAGTDLNATYGRGAGLRFYEREVRGVRIRAAESPVVVCHELGHAILDAVQPQLWDAAGFEPAAFHESFGDISAILCSVQIPFYAEKVVRETGGHLNTNSRLSRLGAQLGWGLRQLSPTAADADCLRNAANRFFYQRAADLPGAAPASILSSDAHSFSRIFTGAFLDAIDRVLTVDLPDRRRTGDDLRGAACVLGRILIDAILRAPIASNYFSQVAGNMIQVAEPKYREALVTAFVQHGILTPPAAADESKAARLKPLTAEHLKGARSDASDAPSLETFDLKFDVGPNPRILIHIPQPAAPLRTARSGRVPAKAYDENEDAYFFVERLFQLGRVDFRESRGKLDRALIPMLRDSGTRASHKLEGRGEDPPVLKRVQFDCGCNVSDDE
jgi:hypothetical protein